ncbi:tyrosine/serine/threonine protein phosphatase MSG5 RNJ42_01114 [Nakaseomyces bracarensis]|uniref:tyrosine/serine/threonine protein phosphatase MSG5 n=1 Tax=Nakaseomyces bracarensis TaxID=273131 RepID=UPI0038714BE3
MHDSNDQIGGAVRTLHNRNTKNLSLDIDSNGGHGEFDESFSSRSNASDNESGSDISLPMIGTNGNSSIRPGLVRRDTNGSGNNIYKKTFMNSGDKAGHPKRSGNSIYTLTTRLDNVKSTSPVYASSMNVDNKKKLNRVHSLSLSVRTKNLNSTATAPLTSTAEMVSNHKRNRSLTVSGMETSTPITSHHSDTMVGRTSTISKLIGRGDVSDNFNMDTLYSEIYRNTTYTNGPILVVPPLVYLYSEPQLSSILNYQVVINVAKEIDNLGAQIPKDKNIAYYHIPWTHSSNISKDLLYLTDIMHRAVKEGKKVLVHCQCGVSRSASLIVAYLMRYEHLVLNDAYNRLKETAKDISPNMGLIFQLMEFNDMLAASKSSSSTSTMMTSNEEDMSLPKYNENRISNIEAPQLVRDIIADGHHSFGLNTSTIVSDSTSANSSVSTNSINLQSEPFMLLNNKDATLVNLGNNDIINTNYKNTTTDVGEAVSQII